MPEYHEHDQTTGAPSYDTTPPAPGGSVTPSFLLGDGSDGAVAVTTNAFTWPDPAGVADWTTATAYAIGDRVKSTGAHGGRVYKCISAGTSGATDPFDFYENPAGGNRRGDRFLDAPVDTSSSVWWEQETAIFAGWVEGPITATTFAISAGVTLNIAGWPILATTSITIPATAVLDASGLDATGATHPAGRDYRIGSSAPATLMGVGVPGADAATDGSTGIVWGGGGGGRGGHGADGAGGAPGGVSSNGFQGYSLARCTPLTAFNMWVIVNTEAGNFTMGNAGGGGASDTSGGKLGGASGAPGSPVALFTKTLALGGLIDCSGGDGAPGQAAGNTGGGGGGSGGCCVLCYTTRTGAGTVSVAGGLGGAGKGTGTAGGDGSPGDLVELSA